MQIKKTLNRLKEKLNPRENENFLIIEIVLMGLLSYYDFLISFSTENSVGIYSLIFLFVYLVGLVCFYLIARQRILEFGFQEYFTYYSQIIFSFFLGIFSCLYYTLSETNERIGYIICTTPFLFLLAIFIFQKLSLFQVEKFLRKYVINDQMWHELEKQTRKDFKQAETSMRANNVANAIINICKGIERELKVTIFEPFKEYVQENINNSELFKVIKPFDAHGSDPRERTYYNFKNYLLDKRHLTFGNIPFFLLNLTDQKIHTHTPLFNQFADFLKKKFRENYENVIIISKTLFNHNFFTVEGIKISDLRNEAAHPQKNFNGKKAPSRSDEILSVENYITLLKLLTINPKLLELILELKNH